jgi:hypothetical protein
MMRDLGIKLNVTVNAADLIDKLIANREAHAAMYAEAVAGFKAAARRKLEKALDKCDGRQDLFVSLKAPQNYTSAYDTAIHALEMHLDDGNTSIPLDASTFRKLAEDQWDWTDAWLVANAPYSQTATRRLGE